MAFKGCSLHSLPLDALEDQASEGPKCRPLYCSEQNQTHVCGICTPRRQQAARDCVKARQEFPAGLSWGERSIQKWGPG